MSHRLAALNGTPGTSFSGVWTHSCRVTSSRPGAGRPRAEELRPAAPEVAFDHAAAPGAGRRRLRWDLIGQVGVRQPWYDMSVVPSTLSVCRTSAAEVRLHQATPSSASSTGSDIRPHMIEEFKRTRGLPKIPEMHPTQGLIAQRVQSFVQTVKGVVPPGAVVSVWPAINMATTLAEVAPEQFGPVSGMLIPSTVGRTSLERKPLPALTVVATTSLSAGTGL